MSKPKEVTIYKRGSGQRYGDFRPYGGKLEALIEKEKGETRATTDYARAQILVGERLKELETTRRQGIVSTGRSQETPLGAFAAYHLKQKKDVRAIMDEKVAPGYNPVAMWGHNRPKGKKTEAHWLEVHKAALLLEAAKLYKPERSDVAIPDLHALIATHLLTGGRPAEVRGLAIADVSFQHKTVTFRPNEQRRLKTDTSTRTVPLWPQLEEILTAYLKGPNAPKGKLLFPSSHRRVRGR